MHTATHERASREELLYLVKRASLRLRHDEHAEDDADERESGEDPERSVGHRKLLQRAELLRDQEGRHVGAGVGESRPDALDAHGQHLGGDEPRHGAPPDGEADDDADEARHRQPVGVAYTAHVRDVVVDAARRAADAHHATCVQPRREELSTVRDFDITLDAQHRSSI